MATESVKNWIEAIRIKDDYHTMHEFPGDGGTDTFEVNFSGGYINAAHVKGTYTDPTTQETTPLALELVGKNTFRVTPVPPAGTTVTIFRDTPKETPLLSFVDGAIITAPNLDRNAKQAIFAIAEILDRYNISISEQEEILRRLLVLEGNQEWVIGLKEYFENIMDDLTNLKSRTFIYTAVGGETSFPVDLDGAVLAVPAIYLNGSRQEVNMNYAYDYTTKTVSELQPGDWQLVQGDVLVCMAAEGTVPLADLLQTRAGADNVRTASGLTVQEELDLRGGVNVLSFMTKAQRKAVLNYTLTEDVSGAFRLAFATGIRQVMVPPGLYLVRDLEIPTRVKMFGSYSYKPYNATSDASFGKDGTIIRKVAGADDMFLWNTACAAEGIMFDGSDRRSAAIKSKSGGKITVGFYKCGFYRFDRVGNRHGAYLGCSFQFCNFNQNNIGIYNTVDGNHIGCTINANKSHGVQLETGADSNTFTNCRNEWNEGDNWNFYGCVSIQVINELSDRAFGYGFRISNANVRITNVDVRRSARTATGAGSAHFYIENSIVKMMGVTTSAGPDDTGGSVTTISPDYVFRFSGPANVGRLELIGCRLTGGKLGVVSGTIRPAVMRITDCPGWDDYCNEGVYRKANGRTFYDNGTARGVANVVPLAIPLSTRSTPNYDNDIFDVHVVWRNTSAGGSNGAVITLVAFREGGNTSYSIVKMDSRGGVLGEGDMNLETTPASQLYQVTVVASAADGSAFELRFQSKATNNAVFFIKAFIKS